MMDDSPPRPLCAPVQIYLFFVIFVYCDWLCYLLFKIRLLFAALREIFCLYTKPSSVLHRPYFRITST
jgi:hypothetical protein